MTDRIDALKALLTRLVDSREGYAEAIGHVGSPAVKSVLEEFRARRARDADEVRAFLARDGHVIEDDGSLLAAAHRTFVGLKDAVTTSDDAATLGEVLRGEKVLLGSYDDAVAAEADGPGPEYGFLIEQQQSLKAAITQLETRHDLAA